MVCPIILALISTALFKYAGAYHNRFGDFWPVSALPSARFEYNESSRRGQWVQTHLKLTGSGARLKIQPHFVLSENAMHPQPKPIVGVIMGSKSDWETLRHADDILKQFEVPHECRVVSAHRTPQWLTEYAAQAESNGIEVIIAGAGGAAHLPGMTAAQTIVPVLGVPVESQALKGLDSLLSIVQMPGGIPVGVLAIGKAGAINAALLAIAILANSRPELREKLREFRRKQTEAVLNDSLP
jgi:5-(carboxyamino)imidazole ribonucleotide mutase